MREESWLESLSPGVPQGPVLRRLLHWSVAHHHTPFPIIVMLMESLQVVLQSHSTRVNDGSGVTHR